MTPDLDQSLSLQASLKDKVTPALEKIQQGAKTTQQVLNEMSEKSGKAGDKLGHTMDGAASKTDSASRKIREDLVTTGRSFTTLGDTAEQGATKVGRALQDALYTKGANDRLNRLEKDLSHLNQTFRGMASSNRAVGGKARKLSATSYDAINKKLIPAFQELHGTLDDYPETLRSINALEQERLQTLNNSKGAGIMGAVSDRVAETGGRFREINIAGQDIAAGVMATSMGVSGMRTQDVQTKGMRLAGEEAFRGLPQIMDETLRMTDMPVSEWQDGLEVFMELSHTADEALPGIMSDMVKISKATGTAGAEVMRLRDQMVELGGIDGAQFVELYDNVKYFADNSRASLDEIEQALMNSSETMLLFVGDARKAYADAVMASTASAKEIGLAANDPATLIEKLRTDPEAVARAQGFLDEAGMDMNVSQMMKEGRVDELFAGIVQAMQSSFSNLDLSQAVDVQAFRSLSGGLIDDQMLMRLNEAQRKGEVQEAGGIYEFMTKPMAEVEAGKAEGTIARQSEIYRTETIVGQLETLQGTFQKTVQKAGEITVDALTLVGNQVVQELSQISEGFRLMDESMGHALSKVGAAATIIPAANSMANVTSDAMQEIIPGGDLIPMKAVLVATTAAAVDAGLRESGQQGGVAGKISEEMVNTQRAGDLWEMQNYATKEDPSGAAALTAIIDSAVAAGGHNQAIPSDMSMEDAQFLNRIQFYRGQEPIYDAPNDLNAGQTTALIGAALADATLHNNMPVATTHVVSQMAGDYGSGLEGSVQRSPVFNDWIASGMETGAGPSETVIPVAPAIQPEPIGVPAGMTSDDVMDMAALQAQLRELAQAAGTENLRAVDTSRLENTGSRQLTALEEIARNTRQPAGRPTGSSGGGVTVPTQAVTPATPSGVGEQQAFAEANANR